MSEGSTVEAEVIRLRQSIETQMRRRILSAQDRRSERILESRIQDERRVHAEKNIEVVSRVIKA